MMINESLQVPIKIIMRHLKTLPEAQKDNDHMTYSCLLKTNMSPTKAHEWRVKLEILMIDFNLTPTLCLIIIQETKTINLAIKTRQTTQTYSLPFNPHGIGNPFLSCSWWLLIKRASIKILQLNFHWNCRLLSTISLRASFLALTMKASPRWVSCESQILWCDWTKLNIEKYCSIIFEKIHPFNKTRIQSHMEFSCCRQPQLQPFSIYAKILIHLVWSFVILSTIKVNMKHLKILPETQTSKGPMTESYLLKTGCRLRKSHVSRVKPNTLMIDFELPPMLCLIMTQETKTANLSIKTR